MTTILKHGTGYDLVINQTGEQSAPGLREKGRRLILGIRCHACQRVSYHPKDVEERYCGHCHVFHEDHLLDHEA